ncbi:MAG: preprotein translocase subunit SecG, partial [Clostridiales bacterium]|nr:preprotein translocase subunit SecG [Clostridiales bacterium]
MTMVLTILQLISAVTVTLVVLFQSGKRSGLSGSISGG